MAETAFRDFDSFQLIESIVEYTAGAIAIKDIDHRYLLINQAFASLLGLPKEEIIGRDDLELGFPESLLLGDKQRRLPGLWTLDDNAISEKRESSTLEARFNLATGRTVDVTSIRRALISQTGLTKYLLIHSSLAHQEQISPSQLESRITLLQAILDANSGPVLVTDRDRTLVYANQATRDYLSADGSADRLLKSDVGELLLKPGASRNENRDLHDVSQDIQSYRVHEQSLAIDSSKPDHIVSFFTEITDLANSEDSTVDMQSKLARRNSFLSAINAFTLNIGNKMELMPLLQQIADELILLFNADASFISTVHESGEFLEMVAAAGNMQNDRTIRHARNEGMAGSAWSTKEIQVVDNYNEFTARMSGYEHLCQGLAIPIIADTDVAGVIGMTFENYNSDLVDQIDLVGQFAQLVSVAIDSAKLLESKNKEIARIDALNQLSQTMFSSTDLDEVLKKASETLIEVVNATYVGFFEVGTDEEIQLRVDAIRADESVASATRTSYSDAILQGPLIRLTIDNREMGHAPRMAEISEHSSTDRQPHLQHRLGATITIPLAHADTVWGALTVTRDRSSRDFSQEDINLIKVVSNQASIVIHRHRLLETINFQAYHDSLTGLSNRLFFEKNLDTVVQNSDSTDRQLAVLFIDLDGFKSVNDTLGHALGDQLLVLVSDRLKRNLKTKDILARMGGDEFAILVQDISSSQDATRIANRLLKCLRSEFNIDGVRLTIGASIGISFFPGDGFSANELLKNADIAMYQAKDSGKDNFHCFSQVLARNYQRRIQTEIDLKNAIDKKQFELYYQPQVNAISGLVSGVEALVRWHHPQRGLVPPAEFIPIAEESGLIKSIGEWVLGQACYQGSQWQQQGFTELTVAVNIASPQFATANFVDSVHQAIHQSSFDPKYLELEVTESFVMKDIDNAVEKLRELRRLGIKISIDDFGTGYSSLRYLEKLPVDKLKIDRSFVVALGEDQSGSSIASTIILMAKSLNLETIAEGIENQRQLDQMRKMGANQIQGYFYSKPMAASEIPEVVRRINARAVREPTDFKRAI